MQATGELVAGRELDALVAEKVMGWVRRTTESNSEQEVVVPPDWTDFSTVRWLGHDLYELVPAYSTDIAAAWQVVEKLKGVNGFRLEFLDGYWALSFSPDHSSGYADGETAPLAICRAALRAVSRAE